MKTRERYTVSILTGLLLAGPVHGVGTPTVDDLWYYEIGGAEPISVPPNPAVTTVTLGGSGELDLSYSCGRFDPVLSVEETLDQFANQLDGMANALVNAATALIAALPALILQRANPELYNLFQTYLADAQARLAIATKTCEQLEADIADGKNPFEEWIRLAKAQNWKNRMAAGGNIILAKQEVEAAGGDEGLAWLYGLRGGIGQEPIQVIRDTTAAGYNVTLNRAPGTEPNAAGPTGATAPRITQLWSTPAEAADWAVQVLGDAIVMTCQDCAKTTLAGSGLLPRFEDERLLVETGLSDLVSGTAAPSFANLDAQSAPGIGISRKLLETIQAMPSNEQSIVLGRLAAEIAQARTIERALLIRRLLLTGRKVPEIEAAEPAQATLSEAIAELEREIDNLLFETRVRREVVSTTAAVLLERETWRRRQSIPQPVTTPTDPNPFDAGRVRP
jgi:integrating conjugative element protein (TIGR03755 family)